MLGSLVLLCIVLVLQAVAWSSKSMMLTDLDSSINDAPSQHLHEVSTKCTAGQSQNACDALDGCEWIDPTGGQVYAVSRCLKYMTIDSSSQSKVMAVAVLSWFAFLVEGTLFSLLRIWHPKFADAAPTSFQTSYLPPAVIDSGDIHQAPADDAPRGPSKVTMGIGNSYGSKN